MFPGAVHGRRPRCSGNTQAELCIGVDHASKANGADLKLFRCDGKAQSAVDQEESGEWILQLHQRQEREVHGEWIHAEHGARR